MHENHLKSYRELSMDSHRHIHDEVWKILFPLSLEYRGFEIWYENMFDEAFMLNPEREILLYYQDGSIAGIAILKNTDAEKKICTLYVDRGYRGRGIGHALIRKTIEMLGTDKPLITVPESRAVEFESLFREFGFALRQEYDGYHRNHNLELVYNGNLP